MVEPALSCLDIISDLRDASDAPVAAYNFSGGYSLVKATSQLGWEQHGIVMMKVLTSIKRAGAALILMCFAAESARLIKD